MYVRDYMSVDVITVSSDASVIQVQQLMDEHRLHRLPVVDEGRLVGIITRARLRSVMPSPASTLDRWEMRSLLDQMTVETAMESEVIFVRPETTVAETLMLMKEHQIGSFPVVEAGKLVGIFTLTDILTILADILAAPREGCYLHFKPVGRRLLEEVVHAVSQAGLGIHSAFTITPPRTGEQELVVRLDTEEADEVVAELRARGYEVERSCWEVC